MRPIVYTVYEILKLSKELAHSHVGMIDELSPQSEVSGDYA